MSLITHEGKVFSPNGAVPTVSPADVDRVNQAKAERGGRSNDV